MENLLTYLIYLGQYKEFIKSCYENIYEPYGAGRYYIENKELKLEKEDGDIELILEIPEQFSEKDFQCIAEILNSIEKI